METDSIAKIAPSKLKSKLTHDKMLAVPVKDGFCRFYGGYVALGGKARFGDGNIYTCVATETFEPD